MNQTIPTTLLPKQAEKLTDLLREARKYLRNAHSPVYSPHLKAALAGRIGDALEALGVEPDA